MRKTNKASEGRADRQTGQDRQSCTAKDYSASQFDRSGPLHAFLVRPVGCGTGMGRGIASFLLRDSCVQVRVRAPSRTAITLFAYLTQHGIVMDKRVKFTIRRSDWAEEGCAMCSMIRRLVAEGSLVVCERKGPGPDQTQTKFFVYGKKCRSALGVLVAN